MQADVSAWPWLQHERTDAAGLFLASGSCIQSMTEPDPQCDEQRKDTQEKNGVSDSLNNCGDTCAKKVWVVKAVRLSRIVANRGLIPIDYPVLRT